MSALPSNVRRLLERPIDSFEKIELVLALFRATEPQTVRDLSATVQLAEPGVRRMLEELVAAGLVTIELEVVRLTPKDGWGAAINDLARVYEEDRLLVVTSMTAISMDRIRGMAARTFADSFRLRKPKEPDDG